MKQSINFKLKNVKMFEQKTLMIQKFLLNTQMIWMILIKTLKNTIQVVNVKY